MPNPPHQANNPEVAVLPVTASVEEVVKVIRRDGGLVIKGFLSPEDIEQIHKEVSPHYGKTGVYKGTLFNADDPPISGLCGKSRTVAHKMLNHPLYRDVAKELLRDVTYPWKGETRRKCVSEPVLAVSQAFSRKGPSAAQPLHRDDTPQHPVHPEGSGDSPLLGLLVAGTKCVWENGATQLLVGSHLYGDDRPPVDPALCSTAEMDIGDAIMIIGSIWHGAGENKTNERRVIYSMHMTKACFVSDENQFLAIPQETAQTYDPQVQALLGYSVSQPNLNLVEQDDPIKVINRTSGVSRTALDGVVVKEPEPQAIVAAA